MPESWNLLREKNTKVQAVGVGRQESAQENTKIK